MWSPSPFRPPTSGGPIALLEPGFPVLAIASAGRAGTDVARLLGDAGELHGAATLALTDGNSSFGTGGVLQFPRCSEVLAPMVAAIPIQLFTVALAELKGLDADAPRSLTKITETI